MMESIFEDSNLMWFAGCAYGVMSLLLIAVVRDRVDASMRASAMKRYLKEEARRARQAANGTRDAKPASTRCPSAEDLFEPIRARLDGKRWRAPRFGLLFTLGGLILALPALSAGAGSLVLLAVIAPALGTSAMGLVTEILAHHVEHNVLPVLGTRVARAQQETATAWRVAQRAMAERKALTQEAR